MVREHRTDGSTLYVYNGVGSYEPLARLDTDRATAKTRTLYYHADLNGAPEELTDVNGKIVWRTEYQVWGNTIVETDRRDYEPRQNLRFQGQYLDRETGLHYNLNRYYDPDTGRFITPDPIGLAGGLNLYQYAPDPVNWIDPWGWACWSATKKKSAVKNAFGHWEKHKGEFPEFQNAKQYVEGTHKFVESPPQGTLTKVRANGETVYYDPSSNNFVVTQPDGTPKTMFRPNPADHGYPTNLDYYYAQ